MKAILITLAVIIIYKELQPIQATNSIDVFKEIMLRFVVILFIFVTLLKLTL
jgi:hypothetical protein